MSGWKWRNGGQQGLVNFPQSPSQSLVNCVPTSFILQESDVENTTPATLQGLDRADHIRDIRRRVNETRSREEREKAAREEREVAADREIGAELQQMFGPDEPAAKRHKGSGLQVGGHYDRDTES